MKELTHEDWMKNTVSRIMWVWDNNEDCKRKAKVIYIAEQDIVFPVIVLDDNGRDIYRYKHCAEVSKQRRMTNKELSRWLRENPTREFKYDRQCDRVCYAYRYYDSESNEEVATELVIRENDSEWKEPLVEEE